MTTLPLALTGGIRPPRAMEGHRSIATGVGFIARAGVAAGLGVVRPLDLKHALQAQGDDRSVGGALQRARPKAMTATVISLFGVPAACAPVRIRKPKNAPPPEAAGC